MRFIPIGLDRLCHYYRCYKDKFVYGIIKSYKKGDVSINHGNYDSWLVKVSDGTGSISDDILSMSKINPNPANDRVHIELDNDVKISKVLVANTSGENVLQTDKDTFSVKELSKGIYFVKIITSKGISIIKLIIS